MCASPLDSRLWLQNLDRILETLPELDALAGRSVLVTGAGGLVCSAVVDLLMRFGEVRGTPIGVVVAGRSEARMQARFARWWGRQGFQFAFYDASSPAAPTGRAEYILHGASPAAPDRILREPVETMRSNFDGLLALLESARAQGSRRVLFISSSEVYGRASSGEPFREDEYGWIDLLNVRNAYSIAKRAAETLCAAYASEYGVETVIARPGHIYGPTASPEDSRVSSAWAHAAARGEPLVMKSDGAQKRSYCHCLDCASALLTILLKGEAGRAYNISNPDSIVTIRQMAELLSEFSGAPLRLELPTDGERKGFNPMANSSLCSDSLQALGWRGRFGAREGFAETVRVLREMAEEGAGGGL